MLTSNIKIKYILFGYNIQKKCMDPKVLNKLYSIKLTEICTLHINNIIIIILIKNVES